MCSAVDRHQTNTGKNVVSLSAVGLETTNMRFHHLLQVSNFMFFFGNQTVSFDVVLEKL